MRERDEDNEDSATINNGGRDDAEDDVEGLKGGEIRENGRDLLLQLVAMITSG